jgi:hypothetical protein
MGKLLAQLRSQWIGILALFVALGGTAYAAATIGSAQIVDNSVASVDLRDGDVRSVDVRNDSLNGGGLLSQDIGADALTGEDIEEASLGPVPRASQAGDANRLDGKDFSAFNVRELLDEPGPLPLERTFTSEGGALMIFASGSGYRGAGGSILPGRIAMRVFLDGTWIGTASVYTNERDSHKAFVDDVTVVAAAAGEHTLSLQPWVAPECNTAGEQEGDNCTGTDANDNFNATVLEIPG